MEGKNMAVWFEIPVQDIQRAKKFYETIFDIQLSSMDMGDEFKMEVFPGDQDSVSGALVYNDSWYKPSKTDGPLLYLNGNPDLQTVQDKIEAAGGTEKFLPIMVIWLFSKILKGIEWHCILIAKTGF